MTDSVLRVLSECVEVTERKEEGDEPIGGNFGEIGGKKKAALEVMER